jgi:hypothetical protein
MSRWCPGDVERFRAMHDCDLVVKRLVVVAGCVLIVVGLGFLFMPIRVSDTTGRSARCDAPLVRDLSGKADGLCDLDRAFVVWGGATLVVGLLVVLSGLFLARPVSNAWSKAIAHGRAAEA